MRLDSIHIILKEYIDEQEKLQSHWPCDAEYDVPTLDNIYDALEAIESIIYYEPSDAELETHNDSYSEPLHVRNQKMLEMKSESHGRRFV